MILNMGGGAHKIEQKKTVTAGTSAVTVTPDDNAHVLAEVTVNPTPSQTKTVSPKASGVTVTPDGGKLLSSVVINGDGDLIPENVRHGVTIFDVVGTMTAGVSGIAFGTLTTTSSRQTEMTIAHGLGVIPSRFYLVPATNMPMTSNRTSTAMYYLYNTYPQVEFLYSPGNYELMSCGKDMNGSNIVPTNTQISITFPYALVSSTTFYWFALV